jgi:hypothetical protein
MSEDASVFVQALMNDAEAVGFIPGEALSNVLHAWSTLHGSDGVLLVRLPYRPGRKDRQLASVLLQALEQPPLTRSISTAKAWEEVASLCRECACQLVVIENADLLDREGLTFVNRKYLPAVVLVGGERLAQRVARSVAWAECVEVGG